VQTLRQNAGAQLRDALGALKNTAVVGDELAMFGTFRNSLVVLVAARR
jgi:hypothetical protein